MANINLKKLKIIWRGEYNATTTYNEGEVVFYNGSSFAAKVENTGVEPVEGRNWELVAETALALKKVGDIFFSNGTELVRLPAGEDGQGLQVVGGEPRWTSSEDFGGLGGEPEYYSNFGNLGYKLAQMGNNASNSYRTYLMADGLIKAVGAGNEYRNGDPNGSHVYIPSRVNAENSETRFKEVFSGTISNYALDTEDNIWSWGYNLHGQLGHGNTTNIATAKRIEYFVTNNIKIKSVVCGNLAYSGEYSAFFLTTDGKLYACGHNGHGQLGDSSTTGRTTPVRVGTLENITYIYVSAAYHAVYAIDTNKELWVWGANAQGQLGIGDTSNRTFPVKVTTFNSVKKVVAGNGYYSSTPNRGYAIVIQADGTLWGTGYNGYGNLGLGDTSNRTTWIQSSTSIKFKDIACNASAVSSCAGIGTDDELYVWGGNINGQLGDGTTSQKSSPTLSTSSYATGVTKIMFGGYSYYTSTWYYFDALYFQAGNAIYAAGYSGYGNLGTGSTATTNSIFAPVIGISGTIKDWTVYGLSNTYGLSVLYDDGRIDACGYNPYGQTGTHKTDTSTVTTLKKVIF